MAGATTNNDQKVRFVGIIKEVGEQDDVSIAEDTLGTKLFQEQYYPFPLYLDRKMDFYHALGKRKIYSLFNWNPFTWWSSLNKMSKRVDDRHIPGNLAGEGIILGGVLVIARGEQQKGAGTTTAGVPRVVYQYLEQTGSPVPVDDIAAAVNQVLKEEGERQ